jgi:hypothetical protein
MSSVGVFCRREVFVDFQAKFGRAVEWDCLGLDF